METLWMLLNVNQLDKLSKISETKLLFDSVEYVFAFICIILAILIMMVMPVILAFAMIDNFLLFNKYCKLIESKKESENKELNSYLLKPFYDNYLKYYSRFLSFSFSLFCWNIMSLIYIFTGFENVKTGLIEYFYFPFNVMEKLLSEGFRAVLSDFSLNWIYMLLIVGVSFSFLFLGKLIGNFRGKQWIDKVNIGYSLSHI